MEITTRQFQYLIYFSGRRGQNRTLTAAAHHFRVSKATAFSVISALESKKLVLKKDNAIELTKQGRDLIGPMQEHVEDVSIWLEEDMGLSRQDAINEATSMICSVSAQTAQTLSGYLMLCRAMRQTRYAGKNSFIGLPPGTYAVPFTVFKKGQHVISMGDLGFRKPALLAVEGEHCALTLRAKTIRYERAIGGLLKGKLNRLWYMLGDDWVEVRVSNGRWTIPGDAMHVAENPAGKSWQVQIRAAASVGLLNMPESEADLVLFFNAEKADINL